MDRFGVGRCCCDDPVSCVCCDEPGPYAEMVLDLGAGGWTDDECDYCDQVAGEFTVTIFQQLFCNWLYIEEDVCLDCTDCQEDGACIDTADFRIELQLVTFPACLWRAYVRIYQPVKDPSCSCACKIEAVYESAELESADCRDLPVTLTKVSETFDGDACGGALPETITLKAP